MYFRYKTNNTLIRKLFNKCNKILTNVSLFPNYGPREKKHKTRPCSKITCWPQMRTIPHRLVHSRSSLYSKQRQRRCQGLRNPMPLLYGGARGRTGAHGGREMPFSARHFIIAFASKQCDTQMTNRRGVGERGGQGVCGNQRTAKNIYFEQFEWLIVSDWWTCLYITVSVSVTYHSNSSVIIVFFECLLFRVLSPPPNPQTVLHPSCPSGVSVRPCPWRSQAPLHPSIHSFFHPSIHPFIHSFIHSSIHSFIHSLFIRSFVRLFIHFISLFHVILDN